MRCSVVVAVLIASAPLVDARLFGTSASSIKSCAADDLKHRGQLQNKLAGVCVDMCKEVGAFPKCTCPDFVAPDSTPGVMTWPELLEHMDNLSEWGHGQLKEWNQGASALQKGAQGSFLSEEACMAADQNYRMQVQNKLAGVCVDMCKEVGAFPKCTCPDFVAPDSTPGVMTWPELLEHMDNLSEWGHGELKSWSATAGASALQITQSEKACVSEDMKHRMQLQNKLAGVCVDMCKEVGAFPKCTCPDFVAPDSTPGVMTWPELLEHMDNLSEWGHGELKSWGATAGASALQKSAKGKQSGEACLSDDMKHRMQLQNKLAGVCVDMCKEVGAFPKCTCPDFVAPDSTPGVMTWPELLEHMDNLSEWGHGELKSWGATAGASALQITQSEKACLSEDAQHRMQLQNKLAGVCVDMCKEVGAFPKCTCPDFVAPDSTPGIMTWPELLEHMDNLSEWGHGQLKSWGQHASMIQLHAQDTQSAKACLTEDVKHRMQLQNKLAGVCVDMCKEVGAFPKCTCPDFVAPDSTPGVMTWPELLEHMDNLSEWGHGELKAWSSTAR